MTNGYIVEIVSKFQGIGTRLKELHWGSPSYNIHKLIDEFHEEFDEFEDSLVENASALWGFIKPGDLIPEPASAMEFEELLEDLRGIVVGIKRKAGDNLMWTGIINIVDDFVATINKFIYLVKIAKGRANE